MTAYLLNDGDTLVFSANESDWETVTFKKGDFVDVGAATAEELAQVLNRSGSLDARPDAEGRLVLATAASGGHTLLEVDLQQSTASSALGLAGAQAHGSGLQAARLISRVSGPKTKPYNLPLEAELYLVVDGRRQRLSFNKLLNPQATAAEVVEYINGQAKLKGIASLSRDDRVILTSPTVGAGSSLAVEPGRTDHGKIDAAPILGFTGGAALSQPHITRPAELVCSGRQAGLQIHNLTGSPIELHLPTGSIVLPARGAMPLSPGDIAHSPLQRLIQQGQVRLSKT